MSKEGTVYKRLFFFCVQYFRNLPKEKLERDLEAIDWDRISSTYVSEATSCRNPLSSVHEYFHVIIIVPLLILFMANQTSLVKSWSVFCQEVIKPKYS